MMNKPHDAARGTLGDVLYSDPSQVLIPETDWFALVQSISAGDHFALHALYTRTHRAVFTLIMRITSNREMAEELTLGVFHDVWRRASHFDPANGTVLAWVMNQARLRTIDQLREYGDLLEVKEESRALRSALSVLTSHEREAIEAAFFSELTHAEVAARTNQPAETIKQRIRSGLHKLARALAGSRGAMSAPSQPNDCDQGELVCAFALRALSPGDWSPPFVLLAVPPGAGGAATCPGSLRFLADGRPAPGTIAATPARRACCGRQWRGSQAAADIAVVGTQLEYRRARDFLQAAVDRRE
jgi:RNA polymerase sigma-70 factor (ECF subfamily)